LLTYHSFTLEHFTLELEAALTYAASIRWASWEWVMINDHDKKTTMPYASQFGKGSMAWLARVQWWQLSAL